MSEIHLEPLVAFLTHKPFLGTSANLPGLRLLQKVPSVSSFRCQKWGAHRQGATLPALQSSKCPPSIVPSHVPFSPPSARQSTGLRSEWVTLCYPEDSNIC